MDLSASSPWWVTNYQGTAYIERYGHHDGATTERDVNFIIRNTDAGHDDVILDLCCAFGRHTRELVRLGYTKTIGLDLSFDLLAYARRDAQKKGCTIRTVQADIRRLPIRSSVDIVLLLFNSFGFLDTEEENLAVLRECVRALRLGGRIVLDIFTPHPDLTRAHTRVVESPAANVHQSIHYDLDRRRLVRSTHTSYRDGRPAVDSFSSVRLYSPEELFTALRSLGVAVDAAFGGYDGQPLLQDSRRVIAIGHRC